VWGSTPVFSAPVLVSETLAADQERLASAAPEQLRELIASRTSLPPGLDLRWAHLLATFAASHAEQFLPKGAGGSA
jgi:hypothetical protein